jgi:hypothetical protein
MEACRKKSFEKTKTQDVSEQTASPLSSAAGVSKILKVMTESFPFKPLSPLALELTSLLQKKETSSAIDGGDESQKKQHMMSILEAIEQTLPPASVDKAAKPTDVEATITAKEENLTTTLSEIDKLISDVVAEEVAVVVSDKGKKLKKPL